MNAASPTVCPKCDYARTAADSAPAWQCPSCGIAYNKFEDAAAAEGDLRVRTFSVGSGDKAGSTAMAVYGGVLVVFFVILYYGLSSREFGVVKWLPVPIAVCAFFFWLVAYRRLRVVVDVPTSTIAAAAQGYIELHGTAVDAPGDRLIGHLARTPCIWHRFYCVEYDNRGKQEKTHAGEYGTVFILRDETGDCLVDSSAAEVVCDRCQTLRDDRKQCEEWSIRAGDPVYAIGYFSSGSAAAERHLNLKAAHALAAQERDKEAYAARYDANRDGKVDRQETAVARDALRRDAVREYTEQGGVHTLGPSPDGRPFLVIGASHASVASRYRRLAVAHLCVFIFSLGFAAYLWKM